MSLLLHTSESFYQLADWQNLKLIINNRLIANPPFFNILFFFFRFCLFFTQPSKKQTDKTSNWALKYIFYYILTFYGQIICWIYQEIHCQMQMIIVNTSHLCNVINSQLIISFTHVVLSHIHLISWQKTLWNWREWYASAFDENISHTRQPPVPQSQTLW